MITVGGKNKRKVDKFEKEKTDKFLAKNTDRSATEKADKPATEKAGNFQVRRHKLLALVHIAKKEIPLSDDEYRDVIAYWGVKSSADMSNPELEELVKYFESLGFKKKAKDPRDPGTGVGQIHALQIRVREEAVKLHNGEERLKGLVKKIAKKDDLKFCRNVKKLKQLLKVIHLLQNREKQHTA
jgi:phage gp16-like protein